MRSIPASLAPVALDHPSLAMPPDSLPPGPTRDLRRAMARFCDGDAHTTARGHVERLVEQIDVDAVTTIATRRCRELHARGDASLVAALVPAASMAEALGLLAPDDDGAELVGRLTRVGDVIVAGAPPGDIAAVDADARALLALVDGHDTAVATVSVLHQTRGATGALIEAIEQHGDDRPSAVAATKRTAVDRVDIDGFGEIQPGETVAVTLNRHTEFGHGSHRCPGRELALRMAQAITGG